MGRTCAAIVAVMPLFLLWRFPGTMGWVLGFAVYFIVWWTMLFAVLPWGVRTQAESGEVVQGTPASAPATLKLRRIALATTVVASAVFSVLWLAMRLRLIPLDVTPPG
jgi:predicted secreted protein